MLKIIFAGGRDFTSYDAVFEIIHFLIAKNIITDEHSFICISGTAKGADTIFAEVLSQSNVQIDEYPAEWDNLNAEPCVVGVNKFGKNYNRLAGHNRNALMAKNADMLVCVYNGSKGTKNMIDIMKKLNKPTYVFDYDGKYKE